MESRDYFAISGTNYAAFSLGTATNDSSSGNYHATAYHHAPGYLLDGIKAPTGTIERLVYDGLDRLSSTWVGTSDGSLDGSANMQDFNPASPGNAVEVSAYLYDTYDPSTFVPGNGNITRVTLFPTTNVADARVTENFYDWRDRLAASKDGVLLDSNGRFSNPSGETNAATAIHRPITYNTFDNLDEVTQVDKYAGDGVSITTPTSGASAGVPSAPSSSKLFARAALGYDEWGRGYRTDQYDVVQSGTNAGSLATTNTLGTFLWYNNRSQVIKQVQPGGLVGKWVYDGAGRVTKQYSTDGGGDPAVGASGNYSAATTVAGDQVLNQKEFTYDGDSNVILVTTRNRFHSDTSSDTGDLLGPGSASNKSRVSFLANYYDAADRLTDSMDVGTFGGTNATFSRPSSPFARSGTALVTSFGYDAGGRQDSVTDSRGNTNKTYFDLFARPVRTLAAWDGTDQSPSGSPTPGITASTNQATDFTYDGDDHVLTMKAWNKSGTNTLFQTTQYIYSGVSQTNGSAIDSNDLLAKVQYADKTTGNPGSGTNYAQSYKYNAAGDTTSMTDRNGTTHDYTLDALGRMTRDNVSAIGGAVNANTLTRYDFAFDTAGRLFTTTGYKPSGTNLTVQSQTEDLYNGLGQLTDEYQAVGDVVGGPGAVTGHVQYAYSEMSGGANHSRLISMTYPNGRVITYDYNPGLDDSISRPSAIGEGSGTNHVVIEGYKYLGLSTIVQQDRPQNNTTLSYARQSGDNLAGNDGGDQYTGLDRFGRVVDQWWFKNNGTNPATTLDRFQYAYDANGNPLYKNNLGPGGGTNFSELYHANGSNGAYDALDRLTDFRRGTLSASGGAGTTLDTVSTLNSNTNVAGSQSFTLDSQGNTSSLLTNGSTTQTRAANADNQYTAISGSTSPVYDNNGNMTTNEHGDTLGYDAWNRLIYVSNTSGDFNYTYDGLSGMANAVRDLSGIGVSTRYLYYSKDWQVIQENEGAFPGTPAIYSNVWGLSHVNDLVERDQYRDTLSGDAMNERLWAQHDANHNVTSIADNNANAVERFVYDPYGKFTTLTSSWTQTTEGKEWQSLFQGARWVADIGLYQMGFRYLDPETQRWVSQDPTGPLYVDGANLYQFVRSSPVELTDPSGLVAPGTGSHGHPAPPPSPGTVVNGVKAALSQLGVVGVTPSPHNWNFATIRAKDFARICSTCGVRVWPDKSGHAPSWSTPLSGNWVLKYYLNDNGTFNVAVVQSTNSFGHLWDACWYYPSMGYFPVNSDNAYLYLRR